MSERLWYFMHNNEQKGPMPGSLLGNLFRLGMFGTDTLVWSEDLSEWTPAYQIGELVPAAVTAAAPPPAPADAGCGPSLFCCSRNMAFSA